jgi:hypothetical protein
MGFHENMTELGRARLDCGTARSRKAGGRQRCRDFLDIEQSAKEPETDDTACNQGNQFPDI